MNCQNSVFLTVQIELPHYIYNAPFSSLLPKFGRLYHWFWN